MSCMLVNSKRKEPAKINDGEKGLLPLLPSDAGVSLLFLSHSSLSLSFFSLSFSLVFSLSHFSSLTHFSLSLVFFSLNFGQCTLEERKMVVFSLEL